MAVIEKFSGYQVEIPEDRNYAVRQGLWGLAAPPVIRFGLTQPALILLGGVKSMDWLVNEGDSVQPGDAVVFTITGKILYVDTPVAGVVRFNAAVKAKPDIINTDPYGVGWLFEVQPVTELQAASEVLVSAQEYMASLHHSEGCKNPGGLKGGVSGVCRAVYYGIGQQKM